MIRSYAVETESPIHKEPKYFVSDHDRIPCTLSFQAIWFGFIQQA